jgi:hypothetical protein
MPRLSLVAAPLLIVFGLASCGGSGASSADEKSAGVVDEASTTTAAPSISRTEYTKQANAACQTMNDRTKAQGEPGDTPAELAAYVEAGGVIVTDTLGQLRALPMPSGEEAALGAIYDKVDVLLSDMNQLAAALRAGDQRKATALASQLEKDQKAANDASNAYGLTICGS